MKNLDQGSIIYGLRSEKYPDVRCFGIIITASCDIANSKVSKLYYLLGLDAKDWFTSDLGYHVTYAEKEKNVFNSFSTQADKHKINAELLRNFSPEDVERIIQSNVPTNQQVKFRELYKKFCVFCGSDMNVEMRKSAIREDPSPAETFLKKVGKGEIVHYYYLPQAAYRCNNVCSSGLVIDLQEIGVLSIDDAKRICSPGIDYLLLSDLDPAEQHRLTSHYWLETPDDFVLVDCEITSPWREHLMQRFSFGFVRIGLDGATPDDYHQLVTQV